MARLTRVATALGLVMLLVLAHADPGQAAFDPQRASANWGGSCAGDDLYFTPRGQVYMREAGKSGVVRFKAKFRLYRTNVGAGWNFPRLEKTYATNPFPNDALNYGGYLPSNGDHVWTEVYATNSYRLNVKMTWDRSWRRDWTYQADIAYC
jgi:hypothetical protein